MKQKIARFMYGRYGMDQLSRFLTFFTLVLLIISMFSGRGLKDVLFVLALASVIYSYFRTFSRKLDKRRKENEKYLRIKSSFTGWFSLRRDMWRQRKEFKFFKCPSCKAVLRVPKGKGKIRVVCKKCGTAFEKKT